jgi:hypothetical protein
MGIAGMQAFAVKLRSEILTDEAKGKDARNEPRIAIPPNSPAARLAGDRG